MRARTCALAALMTLGLAGPASAQERGDYQLEGATATEGKTLRFVLTSEEEVKEDTEVVAFVSTLSAGEEDVRTTERSLIFPAGTRELAIPVGTVDDAEVEEPEKIVLQVVVANFCCYQITGIITDSDSSSIAFWTGTLPGGFVTTNSTFGPAMVARPEGSAPAVRIPGGQFAGDDMEINSPQWINGGRLRFIVRGADRPVFGQYDQATNTAGFTPNPPRVDESRYRHGISWLLDGSAYLASGGFAWYETPGGPGVFDACCPFTGPREPGPRRLQGALGSAPRPSFPKQFALSAHDTNAGTARELWIVDLGQFAYPLTPGATDQPRDPAFAPDGRYLAYVTDSGLAMAKVFDHKVSVMRLGPQHVVSGSGSFGGQPGRVLLRDPTWWPGSTDTLARIAFSAETAVDDPATPQVDNGPRDIYVVTLRNLASFDGPTVVGTEMLPQSTEFDDMEPAWGPAISGALSKSLSSAGGSGYAASSAVRIAPAGGVVRFTPSGSDENELLTSAIGVQASTVVDTRKGKARLSRTKVPVAGAVFGGGLARVEFTGRAGRGVGLGLAGGSYADCLGKRLGEVRRLDVAVTRGSIRVRGREATAIAPKGARLRVSDRCDGTRVAVRRGKVRVGRRTVKAGKALLVK